ncbi:MAG: hypothetical protein MRQ09_03445 [Candidatus Midichloria sp.]|nr:hypothetical protein [Candidatus Midichloria sp.]
MDTLGIIALNSGVGGVILATKEVIKNYSQEMCNSYEQYHTTPPISEDNNTLQQFAKHIIDHNNIYVTLGSTCSDHNQAVAHASYTLFQPNSGVPREALITVNFTLCEEIPTYELSGLYS